MVVRSENLRNTLMYCVNKGKAFLTVSGATVLLSLCESVTLRKQEIRNILPANYVRNTSANMLKVIWVTHIMGLLSV
jgi:hypothetical protein